MVKCDLTWNEILTTLINIDFEVVVGVIGDIDIILLEP